MVQPHAALQVPDGVLDRGVATAVGFELQGRAPTVGDEGVYGIGVQSASGIASISSRSFGCRRTVMLKRTSKGRQTAATARA